MFRPMGFLDVIAGIAKVIRETIGRSQEDWARLVERHPMGAASLLLVASSVLEGRADALRNQSGWRARRNRAVAKRLRMQASEIVDHALRQAQCPAILKVAPWK